LFQNLHKIFLFQVNVRVFHNCTVFVLHVSVALSVLIRPHTQIRMPVYGDWACVHEQYQNTPKHKSRLLVLLQNMLTLSHLWQGNPWKTGDH